MIVEKIDRHFLLKFFFIRRVCHIRTVQSCISFSTSSRVKILRTRFYFGTKVLMKLQSVRLLNLLEISSKFPQKINNHLQTIV